MDAIENKDDIFYVQDATRAKFTDWLKLMGQAKGFGNKVAIFITGLFMTIKKLFKSPQWIPYAYSKNCNFVPVEINRLEDELRKGLDEIKKELEYAGFHMVDDLTSPEKYCNPIYRVMVNPELPAYAVINVGRASTTGIFPTSFLTFFENGKVLDVTSELMLIHPPFLNDYYYYLPAGKLLEKFKVHLEKMKKEWQTPKEHRRGGFIADNQKFNAKMFNYSLNDGFVKEKKMEDFDHMRVCLYHLKAVAIGECVSCGIPICEDCIGIKPSQDIDLVNDEPIGDLPAWCEKMKGCYEEIKCRRCVREGKWETSETT